MDLLSSLATRTDRGICMIRLPRRILAPRVARPPIPAADGAPAVRGLGGGAALPRPRPRRPGPARHRVGRPAAGGGLPRRAGGHRHGGAARPRPGDGRRGAGPLRVVRSVAAVGWRWGRCHPLPVMPSWCAAQRASWYRERVEGCPGVFWSRPAITVGGGSSSNVRPQTSSGIFKPPPRKGGLENQPANAPSPQPAAPGCRPRGPLK